MTDKKKTSGTVTRLKKWPKDVTPKGKRPEA